MTMERRTQWYHIYPDKATSGHYTVYHTSGPNLNYSGYSRLADVVGCWQDVEDALQLPCSATIEQGELRIERIA